MIEILKNIVVLLLLVLVVQLICVMIFEVFAAVFFSGGVKRKCGTI